MDDCLNKNFTNGVADTMKFSTENNHIGDYMNGDLHIIYYAVYIPMDSQAQDSDTYENLIFEDKNDALTIVKKYKKARFKAFTYYQEAVEFALHGSEFPNNNSTSLDSLHKANSEVPSSQSSNVGEKPSQFRGPTSQNLVKLRKDIESGEVENVRKTIWDNPRYLIGAGDTPSILQEGFRYNGLHVAVKSKRPEMCELILNTISDIKFIKKLYLDDRNPQDRAKILLDLYLNTPDKGMHETPLHFGVKFGALKCVEVLVSFPQCDKNLRNKHGNLPNEIICSRYDGHDKDLIFDSISSLLQDSYYVPVLRAEDNCSPAVIGEPFSPTSPPNYNTDPLSPRMEIHAYAGPMNKEGAEKFRKIWKTPPRTLNFGTPKKPSMNLATLKLRDPEKGIERLGNNLAKRMEVEWKEYWPFLDCFIDIASQEGLNMLENYLAQKVNGLYKAANGNDSQSSPELIKSGCNSPLFGTEDSPISELCKALQACSLKDSGSSSSKRSEEQPIDSPFSYVDKSLQVFAKRISKDITHLLNLQYDTCVVLELQIKQLQLLMSSYIDDTRFSSVDFHLVHGRLAYLIKMMLMDDVNDFLEILDKMLDLWLEFFDKNYDCFSSDDEAAHNTVVHSKNQHTICILKKLQELLPTAIVHEEVLNENDCVQVWKLFKACSCTWKHRNKRVYGNKRSNSFKMANKKQAFTSRKLSFDELDGEKIVLDSSMIGQGDYNAEFSDDDYYTPPSSPDPEENESDEDCFEDTCLPTNDVFIEGDEPTKVDSAVYNALQYVQCDLNATDYPHIYQWKHAVSLYNDNQRSSWISPSVGKCKISPTYASTPIKSTQMRNDELSRSFSSSQWLRITGANSPRASLRCQKGNISFNI